LERPDESDCEAESSARSRVAAVADKFVAENDGDVMKALKSMIVLNGRMHERHETTRALQPSNDHQRPNSALKLTGVQIGESEEDGRPVGILTLGTLAGPFDFVITDKAAGGQRQRS